MAKQKIGWSVEAKHDLYAILGFYIDRNGSVIYSKKLNAKIEKSIKLISKNPFIGTQTNYDSVRALITGDYQIIYEIFEQLIVIVMIWDCRRNPEDKRIGKRIK
jgi:plasmid stabilization system protein ParE